MKIALFAAFPQELTHIVKNAARLPGSCPFPLFGRKQAGLDLIALETGMQTVNLELAFEYIRKAYAPDLILSVGFGGALFYRADIGDLVCAARYFFLTPEGAVELPQLAPGKNNPRQVASRKTVIDKIRRSVGIKEGCFVGLSEWKRKKEVRDCLPRGIPFPVCDRETIHLRKMAYRTGTPFFAVRAITDTLDHDIPRELFDVMDENGMYRRSLALRRIFSRPDLLLAGLRLGRNASRASKNLGRAVNALVEVFSSEKARTALLSDYNASPTRFF